MEARFKIEAWTKTDNLEREIAIVDDIMVARAAFNAAAAQWPDARLTLRQGIRVLMEHPARS